MIRASPELVAVARRWHFALRDKDEPALLNLMTENEALRYIGTADGEIWSGAMLRKGLGAHAREIPDYDFREMSLEAFENGDTGWALFTGETTYATGGAPSFHRYSFVFVLESGAWKVVQVHGSNTVSNVAKMGIEHTALDALVAAAKAGFTGKGTAGTTSVMFTDIAGSSALAQVVGDTAWADLARRHLARVTDTVEAHGGRLIKSLGDGTMSTFPSAGQAMLAALDIQAALDGQAEEPRLRVRIGLHTGDVVQAGDDFFGTVVNKAARIAALAGPGEIRVSDATRIMVGSLAGLVFSDPARVALKGLEGDHLVYRLERGG
ncbi:nuclear transport factor 2 family protein [Seohaeicola zhoushanensis]|uniref:Guanylate cyclase domain-containing protein n=1 Tax=Seohaeicola zhoushanensis TaxID=1569283 RepID=A0A8J3H1Z5_9RHOB|nr:adenylate/guanylate cyclase domain-containing protein [Seohaeicola zhoushanensis]GHF65895.1 hypothetical protein GCM10017056_41350 [Seohaeicola zhoushanensis]